jgi:MFS family permease
MVSIPFWMALTAPIFGYLADNFGRRIFCLGGACLMGMLSPFLLMVISSDVDIGVIYICLIIYGIFISAL